MNMVSTRSENTALRDYSPQQLSLIKKTVAKDCNDLEFDLFVEIARRQGLDPFRKQIYAIVTNKTDEKKRQLVTVTGIDGYRVKAARCQDYRPSDEEPEFVYKEDLKNPKTNPLGLEKAIVTCFKQDSKGVWNQVKGVAYWDEFVPLKEGGGQWIKTGEVWEDSGKPKMRFEGNGDFQIDPAKSGWTKSPRNMLAKCAEAQALRKGWPEEFSGLYVAEEMDQQQAREMSASELVLAQEKESRLTAINHKKAVPILWEPGHAVEYVPIGQMHDRVEAWLRDLEGHVGGMKLTKFLADNKEGLRHFWAEAPTDALEVKKMTEAKAKELESAT